MGGAESKLSPGLRVLVAEDNFLVGDFLRLVLVDLGCTVTGPVDDIDELLSEIRANEFDGAVLDLQLSASNVLPAAAELERRGVPFILATGRSDLRGLSPVLTNAPLLAKPFDIGKLEDLVRRTFQPRGDGAGRQP
jgi:DNA-binding response OmpR family regulator